MEGRDNIKDLFSQKLGNYEAPVNSELWAKISSQVASGTVATSGTTGLSLFAKVVIGIGLSAAAITTVVLLTSSPNDTVSKEPSKKVQIQKETPTSTTKTEKEQVAEVSDENVPNTDAFTNSGEYSEKLSLNQGTSETSSSPDPNFQNQEAVGTSETETSLGLPTRETTTITGNNISEPTIVEGVSYGDMTNYGATPANRPTTEELESKTPKVESIKRYVNVFTPNGDGINDYFQLESEGLTDFSVVVMNAEGDIVFQSDDPSFRWDGRDIRSGEMVETGTYMYMVSAKDADGDPSPIYERLMIKR